jgi:hypothetical protein
VYSSITVVPPHLPDILPSLPRNVRFYAIYDMRAPARGPTFRGNHRPRPDPQPIQYVGAGPAGQSTSSQNRGIQAEMLGVPAVAT